ncbi:MAG: FHA domain-containing protein [Gammaproteobacteria bacterium]|nr:FHA domain-containing protein [Gammaproteobacteria bacterium]
MGIKTAIRGSVRSVMGRKLTLSLGSEQHEFDAPEDLKDFLKGRAQISASTLSRLKDFPAQRLDHERAKTSRLYKAVLGLLLQVVENRMPMDMLWREMDIDVLPDERQWPAILFAISSSDDFDESAKRESVERFVEYLRQRKALLDRLIEVAASDTPDPLATAEIESMVAEGAPMEAEPDGDEDDTAAAMTRSRDYRRMPGEREIIVHMKEGDQLPVYLARWKILLRYTDGNLYFEEDGVQLPMESERTTIGRSSQATVALTGAPMDVSRTHLVVAWKGDGRIGLTDVSSKGTWLPGSVLDEAMTAA